MQSPESGRTLERCAGLIGRCNDLQLPVFLECAPVVRNARGDYEAVLEVEAFARTLCVAAALGETSTRTWLRLPVFEGLAAALEATTLPVLVQGGPPRESTEALLREIESVMAACPTVRGVMMGRPILYPGADDPLAVAAGIETIVRRGVAADTIIERLDQARGAKMDGLTSLAGEKGWRFEGGTQTASFTVGVGSARS